jgi:hypothetical protein
MDLKNARLGRAEDLSEEDRKEYNIQADRGLILIVTTNPDLRDTAILINPDDDSGGIRGYLLSLGNFNDIPIDETE